jgi:hypothetical protein
MAHVLEPRRGMGIRWGPVVEKATIREIVERTTAEQGVPLHVEDPAALRDLAVLLARPHRLAGKGEHSQRPAARTRRSA